MKRGRYGSVLRPGRSTERAHGARETSAHVMAARGGGGGAHIQHGLRGNSDELYNERPHELVRFSSRHRLMLARASLPSLRIGTWLN